MKTYVVVGRLCDHEDHVKLVKAESLEKAIDKFEYWVRAQEDNFDIALDFYIEHCTTIEQLAEESAALME